MATCKEYIICHIFDRELRCAREILAKGMYVLISSVSISDIQTTNQVWIQDLLLCQIARILNIELVFVSNLLVCINQHKRMVHTPPKCRHADPGWHGHPTDAWHESCLVHSQLAAMSSPAYSPAV